MYSKAFQLYIFNYTQIEIYVHIYIYIYILFHILFHYGLLQDMEYSSLCYTVGPCCLSVLYIVIYSSSVCFEKCIMFCIYHYSIMQYHCLKKALCSTCLSWSLILFLRDYSCFTVLYNKANQSYVYIYHLPCHRVLS